LYSIIGNQTSISITFLIGHGCVFASWFTIPEKSKLAAKAEYSGGLCQPRSAFESAAQIISELDVSEYLLSLVSTTSWNHANQHLTFGSVSNCCTVQRISACAIESIACEESCAGNRLKTFTASNSDVRNPLAGSKQAACCTRIRSCPNIFVPGEPVSFLPLTVGIRVKDGSEMSIKSVMVPAEPNTDQLIRSPGIRS